MCVGKATRGDIDPSRWEVDQRTFVWAAPSTPADVKAPGSPPWTALTDGFQPATQLPYAPYASGSATTGGEAEFSKTIEGSTPVLREGKVLLQAKVWEPELNGGQATAATMRSVLCSPPSFPASSVDTVQSNPRITYIPVVQKLAEVPYPIDVWKSARRKEESSKRSSSWVEGLIEGDCMQNAATLKRQLSSASAYSAKPSRLIHHKASRSTRPGASKKGKRATPFKDGSVSESLSDSVDEEGVQVVSEKRRKRMLSNRASAQRSRQRRQERLDTLEVLVAELRVENTSLVRKAKNATAIAKKFEDENKILRKRVGKQEALPLFAGNNCDVGGKIVVSEGRPTRISSPSHTHGINHEKYPRESLGSSKSDLADEPLEDSMHGPHLRWNNISRSSFDAEFTSDPMKEDSETDNKKCRNMEHSGGMTISDLRQSKPVSAVHQSSFQDLEDPFSIDLEQCSQEMDRNLDSRGVEDMWLSGCWATA